MAGRLRFSVHRREATRQLRLNEFAKTEERRAPQWYSRNGGTKTAAATTAAETHKRKQENAEVNRMSAETNGWIGFEEGIPPFNGLMRGDGFAMRNKNRYIRIAGAHDAFLRSLFYRTIASNICVVRPVYAPHSLERIFTCLRAIGNPVGAAGTVAFSQSFALQFNRPHGRALVAPGLFPWQLQRNYCIRLVYIRIDNETQMPLAKLYCDWNKWSCIQFERSRLSAVICFPLIIQNIKLSSAHCTPAREKSPQKSRFQFNYKLDGLLFRCVNGSEERRQDAVILRALRTQQRHSLQTETSGFD